MSDLTIGQLKARIAAHNERRAAEIFAKKGAGEITDKIKRIAAALREYGTQYRKPLLALLSELFDDDKLTMKVALADAKGSVGQISDPPRGMFVVPTSNPNSHNYGRNTVLIVRDLQGMMTNGVFGNNLPTAAEQALRAAREGEIGEWLDAAIARYAGRTLADDVPMSEALRLWSERGLPAAPGEERSPRAAAAKRGAAELGCQTSATQTLLTALDRPDLRSEGSLRSSLRTAVGRIFTRIGTTNFPEGRIILSVEGTGYVCGMDPAGRIEFFTASLDTYVWADAPTARAFLADLYTKLLRLTAPPAEPAPGATTAAKKSAAKTPVKAGPKPTASSKGVAPKKAPAVKKSAAKKAGKKNAAKKAAPVGA